VSGGVKRILVDVQFYLVYGKVVFLSLIFSALYTNRLIIQLRRLGLDCSSYAEFFGCLLYADDILLMSHTVRSVQMMLHIFYEFADHFDVEFNISKFVAMRIGNRYSERCVSLQIAGKDIRYVNESKYLDVCVIAVKYLKFL